jgi:hypothetical protein
MQPLEVPNSSVFSCIASAFFFGRERKRNNRRGWRGVTGDRRSAKSEVVYATEGSGGSVRVRARARVAVLRRSDAPLSAFQVPPAINTLEHSATEQQ